MYATVSSSQILPEISIHKTIRSAFEAEIRTPSFKLRISEFEIIKTIAGRSTAIVGRDY